jgi:pimeloyl-ACP methyl ester carboxylesterase
MMRDDGKADLIIGDVRVEPRQDSYYPTRLMTNAGIIEARYYQVPGAQQAIIWVGGVGGGWDTPAWGLYPRVCQEFINEGLASLRIRYRHPTILQDALFDVRAGMAYLQSGGIKAVALVGHSLGGAIVIQAAAASNIARTVVTLATQSYGTESVRKLPSNCSLLLIHGKADESLPALCSQFVYQHAHEPKRLVLYEGAHHGLTEVAEEVSQLVFDWISEQMLSRSLLDER